ncbi:hypothetical protein BDZ89DRAFT_473099 [Hymenopellis radicata]|nr:hypothetical protein BDZ89DRAFT_473099 [Hymenopellis radicata]
MAAHKQVIDVRTIWLFWWPCCGNILGVHVDVFVVYEMVLWPGVVVSRSGGIKVDVVESSQGRSARACNAVIVIEVKISCGLSSALSSCGIGGGTSWEVSSAGVVMAILLLV